MHQPRGCPLVLPCALRVWVRGVRRPKILGNPLAEAAPEEPPVAALALTIIHACCIKTADHNYPDDSATDRFSVCLGEYATTDVYLYCIHTRLVDNSFNFWESVVFFLPGNYLLGCEEYDRKRKWGTKRCVRLPFPSLSTACPFLPEVFRYLLLNCRVTNTVHAIFWEHSDPHTLLVRPLPILSSHNTQCRARSFKDPISHGFCL